MDFTVVINDSFLNTNSDDSLSPIERKHLLGLANGFEDGKWRYDNFESFIWDNIAETALSLRERESLVHGSHTVLREAAKNLRLTDSVSDLTRGSELAEILLYGVMKHHFGALSVVPKIFYKQNSNDFAKGADSVHIVVGDSGAFTLWFGEAKFYNSIEDARLGAIIDSVEECLLVDKLKKENSIIVNLQDLDLLPIGADTKIAIRDALASKTSIDEIKPRIHVPILLLHECEITMGATVFDVAYRDALVIRHKERAQSYFSKQIKSLGAKLVQYSDITFHLILVPVPSKPAIVDRFLEVAKIYKGAK